MKKRIFSLFLMLCMVASLVAVLPVTACASTEGYYTYTVENGEATITDCDTSISGDITIPSKLGGYPVTSIGESAFQYCNNLTSITIPDGVTSIGNEAFSPSSLTSITIPDSVTNIGESAFSGCDITSITIPDGVTSIGNKAFGSCHGLTSITIPNSVISIGHEAFFDCSGLTSIDVCEDNQYYSSLGGVLFDKDIKTLIQYPIGKKNSEYIIPDGVTSINDDAFAWSSYLTSVTIPDSVTNIGDAAFILCISLTSTTIPDSVTSIGRYAFSMCDSLTSVIISNSVTSIGDGTFTLCVGLTSITIPESVTSIGESAFEACVSLTDVYYGGSESDWAAISIGDYNEDLTNATMHYNYNPFEDMFCGSSYVYNHSLARTTFEFVEAGFSAVTEYKSDGADDSPIAKRRYAKIKNKYDEYGFTDKQKFYNYGITLLDTTDKAAYSIASKDIKVNGKTKKLVALVVRGGNYGGEWVSNFNVGTDDTYSQGFKKPADDITKKLKSYISAYKSKDVVLWMTGYSRGAAIANLVAANMVDYSESCSYLNADDIFAYTFATPRPVHVARADADNEKYNNIFNIVNPADVVPQVLLSKWGYGRYGVTKTLFTTVPSQVKTYYKNLTGNKYSVPANQKETISEAISLLNKIVKNKNNFDKTYKGIIQDIIYWNRVHQDTDTEDKSLRASLLKKYSPNAFGYCYKESQKIVKSYIDAFEKFGIDLKKYQEILSQIGAVCELNDTSIDVVLEDIIGNLSGKSINAIAVINMLDTIASAWDAYDSVGGKFNDLFTTHEPEVYKAWLFSLDDPNKIYIKGNETAELLNENANKYKTQLIQCPVDVEVTDAEGNVVVSVVNHEILVDELPVVVIDDKVKIFYYDNFDNYNVKITAYEDGEVNYYVSEYASGEEETKRVCYNSISVLANDTLTGAMNDEINTDVANYDLTLSEKTINNTEILTEDNLENLSVEITAEGSGTAADITEASKGDYVTLSAKPFIGAEFIGWYDGDFCISENAEYSFVIDKDYQLCAKFTVTDAEISDITVPEIKDGIISNSATIIANNDTSGVLLFKAYVGDTYITEYKCDVSMSAGETKTFTAQLKEDGVINRITACLYDSNGVQKTSELSVFVVRDLPTGENDEYKYIIYPDSKVEIAQIKTTVGETFEIPEIIDGYTVFAIGENLFKDNTDVKEITVPDAVSLIRTAAFSGCANLKWINFKGSLEEWNCVIVSGEGKIPETVSVATNFTDETASMHSIDFANENEKEIAIVNFDYIKENAEIYFAIYSPDGKMLSIKVNDAYVADKTSVFELGAEYDYENSLIEVFCWSEKGDLKPLTKTIKFDSK